MQRSDAMHGVRLIYSMRQCVEQLSNSGAVEPSTGRDRYVSQFAWRP